MKDGTEGELVAKYSQAERLLGVKMVMTVHDVTKPISQDVSLFHTSLVEDDHFDPALPAMKS